MCGCVVEGLCVSVYTCIHYSLDHSTPAPEEMTPEEMTADPRLKEMSVVPGLEERATSQLPPSLEGLLPHTHTHTHKQVCNSSLSPCQIQSGWS